ncbi:hypothetical protein ILYODFUR_012134 [Ilyodon furcidens]|uniref:Uncharacterized protein n=1 Tax=Ilyodon furcidens TaxID=33524 RepID=A0ABV0TTW8_9TELE
MFCSGFPLWFHPDLGFTLLLSDPGLVSLGFCWWILCSWSLTYLPPYSDLRQKHSEDTSRKTSLIFQQRKHQTASLSRKLPKTVHLNPAALRHQQRQNRGGSNMF